LRRLRFDARQCPSNPVWSLGTVGGGLLEFLLERPGFSPTGGQAIVTGISARTRARPRPFDISNIPWFDDPVALARSPENDIFVELIGGSEGPAKAAVEAALHAGKPVVTANKALLAHHGAELARLAEAKGVPLLFEAAVMGGVPAVKIMREAMVGDDILSVAGILNGTCNYILTEMRVRGLQFAEVLREAQKLGYAEADPSFDIDGIDAAHKLAILAALAFNRPVAFDEVHVEGIREISAVDIAMAEALGFRIKLLGIAEHGEGGVSARVHPCMVPLSAPIARVDGVFNAVVAEGDAVGRVMLEGRGAGGGPTASAVVADLIDIARDRHTPVWGAEQSALSHAPALPMHRHRGAYYLRLMVLDRPGVIADVTAVLRDAAISLESMLQRGRAPGEAVPVVLTTHECEEAAMQAAMARLAALDCVLEKPALIRIETL
jgi:homoserine dehydrogenase